MRKYDSVSSFNDGLAIVKLKNKYGVINVNHTIIVDFKYNYISNFKNGFARVGINNKWGFIDINGNEICELIYDAVSANFENGFAIVDFINADVRLCRR
jgi:hypothetical protein